MATSTENQLGVFLKARRLRLDPRNGGNAGERRRTPGLRREEIADRAGISSKWYTFLEQGRGGPPSSDVLRRLARALELSTYEAEHLFNLVNPRSRAGNRSASGVSPALQRMLDAMEAVPAIVKTPVWDIVAWNRAAAAALTDYGGIPPDRRNLLRLLFSDPEVKETITDWEDHARFAVSAFRLETARVGLNEATTDLVAELSRTSAEFDAMWREMEVGVYGEGVKRITHPTAGPLTFIFATFTIDGCPDLGLMTFAPSTATDMDRVKRLIEVSDTCPSSCNNL